MKRVGIKIVSRAGWAVLIAPSALFATQCTLGPLPDGCSVDSDCLDGRYCVDGRCSEHRDGEGGAGGAAASTGGSSVGSGGGEEGGGAGVSESPETTGGSTAGSSAGATSGVPGEGTDAGGSEAGAGGAGGVTGAGGAAGGALGARGTPVCAPDLVELATGYCMHRREVQRIEYHEFYVERESWPSISGCENNQSLVPGCDWPGFAEAFEARPSGDYDYWSISRPATCVDWCDAAAYCAHLDQHLCAGPFGQAVPFEEFADPSKSLWSTACTQGGVSKYPYGDAEAPGRCIDATTNGASRPEGTDRTSECNGSISNYACIYDLSGNVAEWEDSCDGPGESANCRVRGGSYLDEGDATSCSASASRSRMDNMDPSVGFRCCKVECR